MTANVAELLVPGNLYFYVLKPYMNNFTIHTKMHRDEFFNPNSVSMLARLSSFSNQIPEYLWASKPGDVITLTTTQYPKKLVPLIYVEAVPYSKWDNIFLLGDKFILLSIDSVDTKTMIVR